MAFTAQLGLAVSQPGNVVPGLGSEPNPTWFGFQDATNVQVRGQGRDHRYRARKIVGLGLLDAYVPTASPVPQAAPFPDDPADRLAVRFRRLRASLMRRRLIEALLYQHRLDVDVMDPFLVPRTVRSMLAAGTWEPGGY